MPCCLCLDEEQILLPVFDACGADVRGIAATVAKFLELQLPAHETPPSQICITCWASLDNFRKYCRLIEEKQRTLRAVAAGNEHDVLDQPVGRKAPKTAKLNIAEQAVEVKLEFSPESDTTLMPCYAVSETEAMEEEAAETAWAKEREHNLSPTGVRCPQMQMLREEECSSLGSTSEADNSDSWNVHVFWKIPRRDDGRMVRRRCNSCYRHLKAESGSTYIATRKAKQVDTECSSCKKAFCLKCFNRYHKFNGYKQSK